MKLLHILLVIFLICITLGNVEAFTRRQKERAKSQTDRAKNAQPKRNRRSYNKKLEEKEEQTVDDLKKKLEVELDPKTGIPVKDQQKFDEEIQVMDDLIAHEQDEKKKEEEKAERKKKLEDIQANTERIKKQREEFKQKKEEIEQELKEELEEDQNLSAEQLETIMTITSEEKAERRRKRIEEMEANGEDVVGGTVSADDNMGQWLEDWEKHMKDFKADEMLSFEVAPRSFEVFFEDIEKPCAVRGAFFINFDAKEALDLKILDPKNQEVYKTIGKRQGIFNFNTTEIGTYSFFFQNRRSSEKKTVSFVVDVGDNETHLQEKDIDDVNNAATDIKMSLRTQLSEYRILRRKDKTIDKERKSNGTKILIFSVIETLVILGCTVFQVLYIKKILDNRSFV